jgi:hypothetical protein
VFEVSVIDNDFSTKIGLNADYLMSIQSTHIHLIPTSEHQKGSPCKLHQKCCPMELSAIRFFNLTKVVAAADKEKVLEIISVP